MELPKFVVIQSKYNGKYLRYINEHVEVHGHLQFSGEEAVSPLAKFEVQPVKIGEKELVHIRCCYNNHYWQRWSQNHHWIVAGATEPEEDQSKWSCTLFEPIYIDGNARTIRIRHVQLNHYACLWRAGHPYYAGLFGGSTEQDRDLCDVYTIIDWESLPMPNPIAFSNDNDNQERMELPRYVVIKSNYNGKYLRYINEQGEVHGFLQFSGEEAISPLVKFEVQQVKIGGKDLVHIRCCYNNQYWVSRDRHYIVAGASGPVVERTIRCTLFEPIYINGNAKTVRFFNVQLQRYACLLRATHPHSSCLCVGSAEQDQDQCDVYTIIDWETLLILPKHIAFKGDNGKYLSARRIGGCPYLCFLNGGHPYLKFVSSDIGDPRVGNEIFTTSDGSVRIKSNYHGKFWRQSPNGIWADSDDSSSDNLDTLFWPEKVGNNVVVLRNLGNNHVCKRLTTEGNKDCLSAAIPTITPEAHLRVEELNVISRNIDDVVFHLKGARVYSETDITMATANAVNKTQETNSLDLKLSYTDTKSRTWNSIVTMKLGSKTNLKCGIPLIIDGKIEISGEFSNRYQWGETKTSETIVEPTYKVTVPPMTKVTVSLMATKGFCDVPFSYTQRDTLTNREPITYNMDDGLYNGMNYFNFKFENKETPLDGK